MKQIEILYEKRYKILPQKVEKTLQWYDVVTKEMKIFKGGRLKFIYQFDKYLAELSEEERLKLGFKIPYRMLPEKEEVVGRTTVFQSNKNEFNKWFNNYLTRDDSDIIKIEETDNNAIFNIPDFEFEDFISELGNKGFDYSEI